MMNSNRKNAQKGASKNVIFSQVFRYVSLIYMVLLTVLLCSCTDVDGTKSSVGEVDSVNQEIDVSAHDKDDSLSEGRRVHVEPVDSYTIIDTKLNNRFKETSEYAENFDYDFDEECVDVSFDEGRDTVINFGNKWTEVNGDGAIYEDDCLTIVKAGTYILHGVLTNGSVVVNAGEDENVHIIFNDVVIKSKEGPSINIKKCDDCIITLASGTVNKLEDSENYPQKDSSDGANATLFSSSDLTLNGDGSLCIVGNYNHAISSKDDLIVMDGNYDITSKHDGFHGRDSVRIFDGTYLISVVGDGIDATNNEDDEKGYVCLNGGMYTIHAGDDAVQAESHIRLAPGICF